MPPKNKSLVKTIIEQKRREAKRRGRKFRLPKPNRPLHPDSAQRDYERALRKMINLLKSITRERIIPKISKIVKIAESIRPKTDSRMDKDDNDYTDDISDMMYEANLVFYEEYTDQEIENIASRIASKVDDLNDVQFRRNFKKVLGIDPITDEPWLKQEVKAFVKTNVDLIQSIPEKYLSEVENIVMQGAKSGTLTADIVEEIQGRYDVSESRAQLIVRDQIGKFNGNLNQLRQQNVGVSKYTWSTSLDERVRTSHEEKEGNVYSWNDPPADTGHPGFDFQCRCSSIPVFDDQTEEE